MEHNLTKQKVPRPYSGADDSAPSRTGLGMTNLMLGQGIFSLFQITDHLLCAPHGPRIEQRALFESQTVINFDGARVVIANGKKWPIAA